MSKSVSFLGTLLASIALASGAAAHSANFKSPADGMHFTQGQPLVIFADIFDSRDGKGFIVCPAGQTISNTTPPPSYSDPPRKAVCSGGGTPTGWPQFEVLIDGVLQTDLDSKLTRIPHTISFNHDINPDPIGFFRFKAPSDGLSTGPHRIVVRAYFSNDGKAVEMLDSAPLTIAIDAPPAKSMVALSADMSGPVNWDNVIVVGNGHSVAASGDLVIRNSLVTGLGTMTRDGLTGRLASADIQNSIFEDSAAVNLTISGAATIKNNEFRANNRLTFVASDPGVPFMIRLDGSGAGTKLFQGNRVAAGQLNFAGQNWLIGGDSDDLSNVFMGPRAVLNISGSNAVVRGNYSHHNYRGAWSQGFNFYYANAGAGVLTEHNFIRDSSWPLQSVAGEFRYNVVYGYGHTWLRTAKSNASIHHNIFAPGGDGGLNSGIECYGGENGLFIYNNTFDGGGAEVGDFSGPTVAMSGGSRVASFRNNLVTFSRNQTNGTPGAARVTGGAGAYQYADYNAFFSPDNSNKTNYDFTGAGSHDPSGGSNGQLASTPFSGARVKPVGNRMIESVIDEAAVWQGTQKVSQVLAIFRARYTPAAGSPIIDSGDPQDNDSMGRRTDIGAIDVAGHDSDRLGKFGPSPSETIAPSVTLTAPTEGAVLTGTATLSASATDNPGGSGVALVQFLVDGSTVVEAAMSPYSAAFDSAILSNGTHDFSAKAWDKAGNFAVSAVVKAVAQNSGRPPADAGASGGSSGSAGQPPVCGAAGALGSAGTANADGGQSDGGCSCSVARSEPTALAALLGPLALAVNLALRAARRRRRTSRPENPEA